MLKAYDIMVPNPITINMDATIHEAIKLMERHNIASLVVVNEAGIVRGVITAKDIVIKVIAKGLDPKLVKVSEILSNIVTVVEPDMPLKSIVNLILGTGHGHIPVVNKVGKILGIITVDDILKYVPELLEYVEMQSKSK